MMKPRAGSTRRDFFQMITGMAAGAFSVPGWFPSWVWGLGSKQAAVKNAGDVVCSQKPADVWQEGYPIGNGRVGGMVLGDPVRDRVSLNHDRLWRRFWRYQKRNFAADMPRLKQLCLEEKWEEAHELMKSRIPIQGRTLYVNPFVPLGDIGIYPHHFDRGEITEYRRELDLDSACVRVSYRAGEIGYKREYFVSHPSGVLAIHLQSDQPARNSGEVSLYRMLDSECQVTGSASLDELVLEGRFEEGARFASVIRVIQRGGRLTGGLKEYVPPEAAGEGGQLGLIQSGNKPHWFRFRDQPHPAEPRGVTTRIDAADEVLLLAAAATDREDASDPAGYCKRILDRAGEDYERLRAEHIRDYRKLYRRVSFHLGEKAEAASPTDELVQTAGKSGQPAPVLYEQLFNLGRYLAIAGGRPAGRGEPYKAPLNLQGLWNEDPRPAWDSDYHLDLNLQMCYWPLPMVNLAELMDPMVDWAYALLPQAQAAARDIYGVSGAYYTGTCDSENLGNTCDLGFLDTGVTPWLSQMLWQTWEYNHDTDQLRFKIYPILREIGRFYEEFLTPDSRGRLIPVPSGSPEICPAGRSFLSMLSVPSTFDLELIRQVFENLLDAGEVLGRDEDKRADWNRILEALPYPTLNEEGRLLEWLDREYEVTDPGHRHRSFLVEFCPGDRITAEDTPEYNEGARKALERRLSYGDETSVSIDKVWDAQMFARLYEPQRAMEKIHAAVRDNMMGNLLQCVCEWREGGRGLRWFGDHRVYQIEASFGMLGAITELLLQDRRGLLRFLPALPGDWPQGSVKGLLTRGGFVVDLHWEQGRLTEAKVQSRRGGLCRIKSFRPEGALQVKNARGTLPTCFEKGVVEFQTEPDECYLIQPV